MYIQLCECMRGRLRWHRSVCASGRMRPRCSRLVPPPPKFPLLTPLLSSHANPPSDTQNGTELTLCLMMMEASNPMMHLRFMFKELGWKDKPFAIYNELLFAGEGGNDQRRTRVMYSKIYGAR